ncbi:Hypothetical predicted protein [Olea europaea subsp. europaea]|uniref:DDT domain-containing protein n=1 Tax=Olea europaea subsp. europaea TaxID=158383 RepID=A0A8S0V4R7_OLEEU|nr:Hypothetical predicted protein [Olea europaea subsp. europaea]
MQALDLACNSSLDPSAADLSTMPELSSPIRSSENPQNPNSHVENNYVENIKEDDVKNSSINNNDNNVVVRRERPSRACTQRAAARLQAAAEAEAVMAEKERKRKKVKTRERLAARLLKESSDEEEEEDGEEEDGEENGSLSSSLQQCSKTVTPLVGEPEPSQLPRWNIRSMWQLASILNFLNVFRHMLNIKAEFSAEEFETALIMPNNTLGDIHMPLLKAIPPITRMALGHGTWITVLCRKLRDWWHWVAEGDIPIVASHGAEVEAYNALDPGVRVVILKALCDIRVEQEDFRSFIDSSIKHGVPLSVFRKERLGGDPHGISYWYEDDPIIGQRLYREIRKVEVKKGKGKSIPAIPHSCYQWEAVATNLDEFQNVSEKLLSSKNRTEVSVGKKLKKHILPEVEKVQKRKEKLLKKQHRQALMLDNLINIDGLGAGRSLRDRKHVTYTFDDYDRSINEAIKVTKKKHPSPEPFDRRDLQVKNEASTNGGWSGPSQYSRRASFSSLSPVSPDNDEVFDDHKAETLDYSNRQRQRPQRLKEFVEAISDNEVDSDSDDDIVGEVVYDEEYLRRRKQRRKISSGSEGDEEYNWDEEHPEEEEEEEEDDALSTSEDSDEPRKFKTLPSRTRRETKLRSVDELQSGLRRSKRATRTRIDYRQIEMSESETESMKPEKSNALDKHPTASDEEFSMGSRDSVSSNEKHEQVDQPTKDHLETNDEEQTHPPEKSNETDQDKVDGVWKRHFLDLNELAPGSGFDDIPNSMKDEDKDNF